MDDGVPAAPETLGAALARAEAFARGVGRRTSLWGWVALVAAPAIWAVFLRRWVFDSVGGFLAWLPLLVVMLLPGLVLIWFSGRVRRLTGLSERVSPEVSALMAAMREDAATGLRDGRTTGMAGLRLLVAALEELRSYGGEAGAIVGEAAGTLRILNPVSLSVVVVAAMGAGLLAILVLVAAVLLLAA